MAKKKPTQAPEPQANVGDVMSLRTWTDGMNPTTKEEGSQIVYDQPPHVLTKDEKTWPPKFVILSSLWAFKVIREDTIPSSLRYAFWPSTFHSKAGFQTSWVNNGLAPVVRDEEETLRYPVVFGTIQLHGLEGEQRGLETTSTTMNLRPHNKHSYTFGQPVANNDSTAPAATSSAAQAASSAAAKQTMKPTPSTAPPAASSAAAKQTTKPTPSVAPPAASSAAAKRTTKPTPSAAPPAASSAAAKRTTKPTPSAAPPAASSAAAKQTMKPTPSTAPPAASSAAAKQTQPQQAPASLQKQHPPPQQTPTSLPSSDSGKRKTFYTVEGKAHTRFEPRKGKKSARETSPAVAKQMPLPTSSLSEKGPPAPPLTPTSSHGPEDGLSLNDFQIPFKAPGGELFTLDDDGNRVSYTSPPPPDSEQSDGFVTKAQTSRKRRKTTNAESVLARPDPEAIGLGTDPEQSTLDPKSCGLPPKRFLEHELATWTGGSATGREEKIVVPRRIPLITEEVPVPAGVVLQNARGTEDSVSVSDDGYVDSNLLKQYKERVKSLGEELEDAKKDVNDGAEYSEELEYKLLIADGKVMQMTKTLHASFSTLLQTTETLQMAASIARTFVGLHESWPEKGRKVYDPHKRECDNLLEAVKTTNTAVADVNSRFARLEACFPGTKRITTAEGLQAIEDWCMTRDLVGGKAAEENDALVNGEGKIVVTEDLSE